MTTIENTVVETTVESAAVAAPAAPRKRAAKPTAAKAAVAKAAVAKAAPTSATKKVAKAPSAKKDSGAKKAVATAKKPRVRTLTKKQKTQNLVIRELERVGGDYSKLDRKKITGQMVKVMDMTTQQASTYYHNYLRARHAADLVPESDRSPALYTKQSA